MKLLIYSCVSISIFVVIMTPSVFFSEELKEGYHTLIILGLVGALSMWITKEIVERIKKE